MKKLNRLLIIEADPALEPLLSTHQSLLALLSETPIEAQSLAQINGADLPHAPQLILFHSNLMSIQHLRQFICVRHAFPHSNIVIISSEQDEELCLLALEAGADDSILLTHLTQTYLRKAVLLSLRRYRTEKELTQNREQLLACLQNTPNVAVQWYNSEGEVLFWNSASERIFGWSAGEAVGRTVDELIFMPEDKDFWRNKILHLAETGKPYGPEEWNFHYRDGSEGCCISTLVPLPSFDDKPWFVCMDVEITKRKQAEKALRESEEKYYDLFNQASDAIFINTLDGRMLDVNERGRSLLAYSKEDLLNMRIEDFYSKEELARRPIMRRELESGQRTSLERTMIDANGKPIAVEVTAQKMKNGRVMAIVRDVSERKKAEEAVKVSQQELTLIYNSTSDVIFLLTIEEGLLYRFASANKAFYKVTGLRENVVGKTVQEVIPQPSLYLVLQKYAEVVQTKKPVTWEEVTEYPSGKKHGVVNVTPVCNEEGVCTQLVGTVHDITGRMEIQTQLEKEIALSDSIINSLPGLFYLIRKDGKQLRWNKQLEKVSGYTLEEIAAMSPLDFFESDDIYGIFHAIEKIFETGSAQVEAYLITKDGRRIPYYFTGVAIRYAGEECLLGMAIDLSAVKRLENELAKQEIAGQKKVMQAMIEAEEKEKAKLGLELHDNVNQILSVVRMYLTILASDQPMEEITLPKAIDLLNTAIQEIRHLSHSLAVSYRFDTGLSGTLEDMVENIQLTKDFSIHLSLPADLDERTNNQQKLTLYRIVQEQLNNVIKHAKASRVDVLIALTEKEIRLKVKDNGKGFNPSKTRKGLGLNNIINRVESLAGKAVVYSQPGQGTRLEVVIPL